ncbi:ABC transporter substrate-binding protein [Caldanaerobacter subterraneus]|uniref:ABC transporter substrate-binding protein n=1 Tax=Caldanaerobacter subterraneus TaxID=911092 RepID=A0A7Y2PK88_9THEO|nr:ABC transporter substrate-binding protein [Caldanaerobacter subterraneus]NNG65916.1 ABC transporter substrate-binding protein [Caldanaerobacter subterraneus]
MKHLKLNLLVVLLTVFTVVAITGCNNSMGTKEKVTTTYVEVKDFSGNVEKITKPVNKVITTYSLVPPFIYLLGEGEKFYFGNFFGISFYELLDSKAKEKAMKGKSVNVEEIIKEDPNVVFSAYWQEGNKDIEQLRSLNIPVVSVNLEDVGNIKNTVLMLGKIFGKEESSNKIICYYDEIQQEIESRLNKSTENKDIPKVLVIYYSGKEQSYMTFGGDMFQSKLIELAGGIPVSKELSGKKNVDIEQIIKWNPDFIVIVQYDTPAKEIKEKILKDSVWKNIKAVKEKKVFVGPNDGENWIDPNPKWPLGLYWMAKILHTENFTDFNLPSEASKFYKEVFNIDFNKVKIEGDL